MSAIANYKLAVILFFVGAVSSWPQAYASAEHTPPKPARVASATVSMQDLRDRLDKKIAEVRQKNEHQKLVAQPKTEPIAVQPIATTEVATSVVPGNSSPTSALNPNRRDVATYTGQQPKKHTSTHSMARYTRTYGSPRPLAADTTTLAPVSTSSWTYSGPQGPEHWALLRDDFARCSTGQRQSPIDIKEDIQVELETINFDYHPTAFQVVDNGHTIQVTVAPGNTLTIMGQRFELKQFHFHRPSEERINGRSFAMVIHLEHQDETGKHASVALLIEPGKPHPLVQQVWNNLPLEKYQEQKGLGQLDIATLLPMERQYYVYMGSLTTPPCTEGVLWIVMQQPIELSEHQIAIFSRLYPLNARPIQPTHGRLIKGPF